MLGETAREASLSNPLLCVRAPNPGKNMDLRAVSPSASRQSTGKTTNRPHFAHMHRNNRKGGAASLRARTCVKRSVAFRARFEGLSLYFLYIKEGI